MFGSSLPASLTHLQVLSRFRGLKRRGIAFSGRNPYLGGRFFDHLRESSMRAVTVIGVLLAAGAGTLRAQHAHQFEFGGGGRLAFSFNDNLALEADGNLVYPFPKTGGGPHTQVRFGSVSLVINSGGERNVLYILGGYSRLDMGVNPPYNFAIHAVHAGLGDRIFLLNRLALRLEGRGYYAPQSCCLSSKFVGVVGTAGLSS